MQDNYNALNGAAADVDLDNVVEVAKGYSAQKQGWNSFIVYVRPSGPFVELRNSPPDYRGNSSDEAAEVTQSYVCDNFQLTAAQLDSLMSAPGKWKLVNRRNEP